VVENFAPGVIERLGLSYEVLRERRPGLIMLSISGFGSTGPDRAAVAFGQQVEAECGLMSITGYGDGVPLKPGVSYPDPVAGIGGAGAVAAALLHRDRTGEGQWIDLSMLEITVALLVEPVLRHARTGVADGAHANASRYVAPHGIYPCLGEDRWIAIECHDDAQWRALAGVIADPWVRDHRWESNPGRLEHTTELDAQLAAFTASHTAPELAERLQEAGVPAAAVADPADLAADPQLRATGWWQHVEHPVAGPLDLPGPIARLSVTPAVTHRPPPLLGQHTDEVMSELARV
jgi:benzylsuccinate CoA-transferase BbsF subunit